MAKRDNTDDMIQKIIQDSSTAVLATVVVYMLERQAQGGTLEEIIQEIANEVRGTSQYETYKKENH